MKVSASVELAMQWAMQEAIAAEFKEIVPEHLLIAILRVSELPTGHMDRLAPETDVAKRLVADVEAVGNELARRSIDSARLRRSLRLFLGKGGVAYDGGPLHRSPASRDVFDSAARLAASEGAETLTIAFLLEALLAAPTMAIRKVLDEAAGPARSERIEAPLLSKHGLDLTQMAADGRLPAVQGRQAECRALLRALEDDTRRVVLLVSEKMESARSVVVAAVQALRRHEGPRGLRQARVVGLGLLSVPEEDLDHSTLHEQLGVKILSADRDCCPRCGAVRNPMDNYCIVDDYGDGCERCRNQAPERMTDELAEGILAEAARSLNIVLLLPALRGPVLRGHDHGCSQECLDAWVKRIRQGLTGASFWCLLPVMMDAYGTWIQKDTAWKRAANIIWVHSQTRKDVPTEL